MRFTSEELARLRNALPDPHEDFAAEVKAIWPEAKVSYGRISIPDIAVNYASLMQLWQLLRTDKFTVEGYHIGGGCDTCGWGEETGIEVTFDPTNCPAFGYTEATR